MTRRQRPPKHRLRAVEEESTGPGRSGTVIESYGRRVIVLARDDEARLPCKVRGRRTEVVAGDEVLLEREGSGSDAWVVAQQLPRRNLLLRTDSRGQDEPIAANLDQLGVVVAPRPACDPFMIDRYLAGAGYAGISPLLIVNKRDLLETPDPDSLQGLSFLETYRRIGVRVVHVSAKHGLGLDDLLDCLRDRRTLLAGQSGVGKSSLTNTLCGGIQRRTSELSLSTGEGRHTTVSSALFKLPWGELADSPGVRDYAPPVVEPKVVQSGFLEIAAKAPECRFQDCLHLREPRCAVQAAALAGEIDPRRLESYRRLLNLTRQLDDKRGW